MKNCLKYYSYDKKWRDMSIVRGVIFLGSSLEVEGECLHHCVVFGCSLYLTHDWLTSTYRILSGDNGDKSTINTNGQTKVVFIVVLAK